MFKYKIKNLSIIIIIISQSISKFAAIYNMFVFKLAIIVPIL